MSSLKRLTAERDALREIVVRVEELAVAVENRMTATATAVEIWQALTGATAPCSGAPDCSVDIHTHGCYSLAWSDAERQECTDGRCLTPCLSCSEAARPDLVATVETIRAALGGGQ